MPQAVADPAAQQDRLQQRLADLRRRLRLVALLRGGGWVLTVLFGVALVAGLLDWRFHLPDAVRALFLAGGLACAGYLFYRHLWLPLREKADDLALALRVEERYPGLNDSLASTVQFLEDDQAPASPSMQREAVRRALRGVERCDFGKVIDGRGTRPAVLLALLSLLALAGLAAWRPALAGVAALRLVDPFGGHRWPTKTRLELDEVRTRIGRNEAFEVSGRVAGVVPPTATVVFKFDGVNPTEHGCEVTASEDGTSGAFRTRLEPGRVQRDFSFRVRANDAVSDEYRVTVLPPPLLVPLGGKASPQVRLKFPAYTELPEQDLPDGSGNVEAVAGTVVTLRAAANRELARAWVEFQPEPRHADAALFLGPVGHPHALDALTLAAGGRAVWDRVPARLGPDRREFAVDFRPAMSGMYVLHFEDETGLHNSRLFELRVFPDPAPAVALERPAPARDMLTVMPDATLALQVSAEDPQFALRSVYLEYRCKKTDPPRRLPLYDHGTAAATLERAFAGLVGREPADPPPGARLQRVALTRPLALKEFRHLKPGEGGLKDGDVLTLQVCADDFDDVSVDKQPGRSHEVEVRIVSRNALDLMLTQAQARVQQDLVKLRERQREALKAVTDAQARLREEPRLTPEQLDRLLKAEQLQQEVRERVGTTRQEGLRAEVARILETLRENHLPRTAAQERMEAVERELERLAREELGQIEPRLTNARKQNDPALSKEAALERAAQKEREADEQRRLSEDKEQAAAEAGAKAKAAPEGSPERARLEKEAARDRKQAEEHARRAEELRQQAEAVRKDPEGAKPEDGPRQLLKEARGHQEEVEKTFADLLARLEAFTSTHEVKGEAKALLEEQRRLQQQTEELQRQQLRGLRPEEKQEHEGALERLQSEQEKLQDRARQLLEKMERVGQERRAKDPEAAAELEKAAKQGRDDNITGLMREASEKLDQGQLGEAAQKQSDSARQMEKLVKQLEDRREAELDRLLKKLEEEQKALAELEQEQDRLRKKVQEAEQIADPEKRKEELRRLAREQEKLQQKAKEMAAQLSRQRSERGSQAMSRAAEQMEEAVKRLQRGESAEEEQEEALDRLAEAQDEVQADREGAEEELAREQLAKVADEIKRLKERQEALVKEGARIQGELLQRRPDEWRGLLISLGRLADAQGMKEMGLAQEIAGLAEKKLDGAPVFARVLRKAADHMDEASAKLLEHRDAVNQDGKAETPAGAEATRLQKEALRRLEQLLDALKEGENAPLPAMPRDGGGQQGGDGGGGGGGGGGEGIPPLAELKLLRQLQAEVNRRTEEFRERNPDPAKYDDKAKAELLEIRREQQEIVELFEEVLPPGEPEGDKP
jgi:hypothetical protein